MLARCLDELLAHSQSVVIEQMDSWSQWSPEFSLCQAVRPFQTKK